MGVFLLLGRNINAWVSGVPEIKERQFLFTQERRNKSQYSRHGSVTMRSTISAGRYGLLGNEFSGNNFLRLDMAGCSCQSWLIEVLKIYHHRLPCCL
jgi:hypothetical protein